MTDRMRLLLALSLLVLAVVAGAGCEKPHEYGECVIVGHVVDAETGAPIDSAGVYVTAYLSFPVLLEKRDLDVYTNANGDFELWYDSGRLRLFEVEKEGYRPSSQTLEGSGELYFALEKAFPPPPGGRAAARRHAQ